MFRLLQISILLFSVFLVHAAYNEAKCGRKNTKIGPKVMGGRNARSGEFEFNALLHLYIFGNDEFLVCGGTMVSDVHLITAAHCFRKDDSESARCPTDAFASESTIIHNAKVFVGGICFDETKPKCNPSLVGASRTIKRVALYTDYFTRQCTEGYDIALIELNQPVSIIHACLSHRSPIMDYSSDIHSFGFGRNPMENQDDYSGHLQVVNLGKLMRKETCAAAWKHEAYDFVCTQEKDKKNVCQGDSGSGMLAEQNDRLYAIGIVSFGTGCDDLMGGHQGQGQVNTDVNFYTASIDKFMHHTTEVLPNIDSLPGQLLEFKL